MKNNNEFKYFFRSLVAARRRIFRRDMAFMALTPPAMMALAKCAEDLGIKSLVIAMSLMLLFAFIVSMILMVKTLISGWRRYAAVTFEGQKCKLFTGYGAHYPKGNKCVTSWPYQSMVVAAGGLGYFNFFNFMYWAYPVDAIENIVIGKKRWFVFSYSLITVVPAQECVEGAITYHPRSFKKAIAALEEYGFGDLIVVTGN